MKVDIHYVFMLIGISIIGLSIGAYISSKEPSFFLTTFIGSLMSVHAGFNHFAGRNWPYD